MTGALAGWLRTGLVVAFLLVLGVLGALRLFLLPNIDAFRPGIASAASQVVGQPVRVGLITGGWAGFRPWLSVRNVEVLDDAGRPALALERIDVVFAWTTLLRWQVRTDSLALHAPDLVVRRDRSGALFVAGVPVGGDGSRQGFVDWVLAQPRVVVTNAGLAWIDERREAPPLALGDVELQLQRTGRTHLFSLHARPVAEVGTAIDVRGEFRATALADMRTWRGRIYGRAPYLNLGAVRTWIDLPFRFDSGAGEVEGWLAFSGLTPLSLTLDLRVAGAVARIDDDLPSLDIPELQGRLTWRRTGSGFEATARRLALGVGGGAFLPPADVVFRRSAVPGGSASRLQIESDRLDMAPIVYVVKRLPVDARVRTWLAAHRPAGRLEALSVTVDPGPGGAPGFSAHARFEDLAIEPAAGIPGGRGLSGTVSVDQAGGQLHLAASGAALRIPDIVELPIEFDTLQADADWRVDDDGVSATLRSGTFANPDVSGTASGTFRYRTDGARIVDVKATFGRAMAKSAWRYVPRVVGAETREWLRDSLRGGVGSQGVVQIQGDLRRFPFADGPGRFEVAVDVAGGEIAVGPGWPAIRNVAAGVRFVGHEMRIEGSGDILGAHLPGTTVRIADLGAPDATLEIRGRSSGPTSEFLRFLEQSPVGAMIDNVGTGVVARGDGELELELGVPLHDVRRTRVKGQYAFLGNRIESLAGLPPLSNVRGRLHFSEKGVSLRHGAVEILGCPARFRIATAADGAVRVDANGQADVARLREHLSSRLLDPLGGKTDWRAKAVVRSGGVEFSIDSDLKGIAIDLPAPLGKAAAQAIPTRLQSQSRDEDLWVAVAAADRASATAILERNDSGWRLQRGAVDFGGAARLPDDARVVVRGTLPTVDLDEWLAARELLRSSGHLSDEPAGGSNPLPLAVDLRIGALELYGRSFHDVVLGVKRKADQWSGVVSSREIEGALDWYPEGRGTVVAHLSRFYLPDQRPRDEDHSGEIAYAEALPQITLDADRFRLGALDLGRLVLDAVPEGRHWLLRKLDVSNDDFHLTGQGGWQMVSGMPRSQLAVRLEASDAGRALQRLGRPQGVAGGSARIAGLLEWAGPPYRLDLPSLSGRLSLDARDGRFVQLDPGIGKLFGILSLQALPKRVTLDFRDVFSEGFVFDEITANTTIERGTMRTDDFRMIGSSAKVTMKGTIDIAHESQDLEVKVIPSVSDSIAVGTAIVNPLAGLAALLLGKALDNPLDRVVSFDYRVTGTWTDPVVRSPREVRDGTSGGSRPPAGKAGRS